MATTDVIATDDTLLDSPAPTTNYGAVEQLYFGYQAPVGKGNQNVRNVLFRFDVSGVAGTITVAALHLYLNVESFVNGETFAFKRSTRYDWVESEATWNVYKTGSGWTSLGGDPDSGGVEYTGIAAPTAAGWWTPTITTLVTDAVANRSDMVEFFIIRDDTVDSGETLQEDLDTSETGVDVSDGTAFEDGDNFDRILIDDELMRVDVQVGDTLSVFRGYEGTTAAEHTSGATIYKRSRVDGYGQFHASERSVNKPFLRITYTPAVGARRIFIT